MEVEKLVSFLEREWAALAQAPASFVVLTILVFGAAYLAARWRYAGITENLKEQISTLNGRLIARTEQSESYKERAMKYDEQAARVVNYDSAELSAKTLSFVARLRSFIQRRKDRSYLPSVPRIGATDEERQREWERSTTAAIQESNETTAEWERDFKVDAMMLRDELLSRLDLKADETTARYYERPVNFFGYADVANDLETLAKKIVSRPAKD